MRAYYCNDCGTKADESHFAYSGHRVWGFDPNAAVTSELAHQQPEQPGGFRGGFQGAPLPMTGCAVSATFSISPIQQPLMYRLLTSFSQCAETNFEVYTLFLSLTSKHIKQINLLIRKCLKILIHYNCYFIKFPLL